MTYTYIHIHWLSDLSQEPLLVLSTTLRWCIFAALTCWVTLFVPSCLQLRCSGFLSFTFTLVKLQHHECSMLLLSGCCPCCRTQTHLKSVSGSLVKLIIKFYVKQKCWLLVHLIAVFVIFDHLQRKFEIWGTARTCIINLTSMHQQ